MTFYRELAPWWPLISPPEEYAEEASLYVQALKGAHPEAKSLLELGSGGGHNALHMKAHFDLTLSDISEDMLAMSQKLNPALRHVQGDMRALRLEERFDAVFIQDAISYITTLDDLRQVFETAKAHLKPGGICLIAPDDLTDTFKPGTSHGGEDDPDASRGVRYLEWSHPLGSDGHTSFVDYLFILREGEVVTTHHERHANGVFSEDEWRETASQVGLGMTVLPWEHSDLEPGSYRGLLFTPKA